MANRYHGEIIVVDSTDTQLGGTSPTGGTKGPLSILAMQWTGTQAVNKDIAKDDDLTIKLGNASGDIVIAERAANQSYDNAAVTVNQNQWGVSFGQPWTVPGLYIEDLDGGELTIYLS